MCALSLNMEKVLWGGKKKKKKEKKEGDAQFKEFKREICRKS